MPDNLKIKEPLDRARINIHEAYEVNWWCKKFDCTKLQLENAVRNLGTSALTVGKHFKK